MDGCPSLEQFAAHLDNSLSERGRAEMRDHLAVCPICRHLLADTVQALMDARQAPADPAVRRRPQDRRL